MRIKQLNKIKGNYEEKEDYEKQRNEQINTMINNYKHFKMDNRRINVYPTAKIKNNLKVKEKKLRNFRLWVNKENLKGQNIIYKINDDKEYIKTQKDILNDEEKNQNKQIMMKIKKN